MTGFRMLLAGGAAALLFSVSAVQAQQSPTPETPASPSDPATDPCTVAPGVGGGTAPRSDTGPTDAGPSLSETLERCRGVLAPPAVGDRDLVEPAPDQGVTPVIPPSAVPEAQ